VVGRATQARPSVALVSIVLLGLATLVLAIVSNGSLIATFLPAVAVMVGYVLVKVPLRHAALVYIALVITLDNPIDEFAAGQYKSPLYSFAALLSAPFNTVLPIDALIISGLDVFLVVAFLVHAVRRAKGSPLDREGFVALPMPLIIAAWACLLALLMAALWGLWRGGSFRFLLWQVQRNIYLPLFFLLFQAIFPSAENYKTFLKLVLALACIRAMFALILRGAFPDASYATSHADSMLFGTAFCMLVVRLLHGPSTREIWKNVGLLLVVMAGMVANDRRLVWAQVGVALAFVFFMTGWTQMKLRAVRGLLVASPFVAAYFTLGWNSGAKFFSPVATVRSMIDSKSDTSTMWRDLENFNLVSTYSQHPILGTGFGHPFEMAVKMPDITSAYELEPYVPHNSVVGLWAYTGYVGFTLIWVLPLVGMYFAARSLYLAREKSDRVAALTCFCCIVIYALQCYGDLGLGSVVAIFLLAPSLAMVGKLAVKVGAWPRVTATRQIAVGSTVAT
jgi:hypothetical protein